MMDGSVALDARSHHGFACYVHGLMSAGATWFMWYRVPETRGRILEAIEALWKGPRE